MDDTQQETHASAFFQATELYENFARSVTEALAGGDYADLGAGLDRVLEQFRGQLADLSPWQHATDAWSVMVPGLGGREGDSPSAGSDTGTDWAAWLEAWMPMPLVGPLREWQRLVHEVSLAATRQSQAQLTLSLHYRDAMVAAIDALREQLAAPQGKAAGSLDELHRQWTEIADRCYRDVAMREEFSRDFGEAVNTASALRQSMNALAERMASLAGVPSPDALAAMERRLAELETAMASHAHTPDPAAVNSATTPAPDPSPPSAKVNARTKSEKASPERELGTAAGSTRKAGRKKAAAKQAPQKKAPARKRRKARARTAEFDIADFLPPND